jgi:Cu/Ag efflux protein CusF
MKQPSLLVVAALLGALSMSTFAQQKADANTATVTESSPGKVAIAKATKITATVEAIDQQTREVTLKGPKGNVATMTAGPDVRNLDKIKVGDKVVVRYVEALSLTLKKDGKELRSRKDTEGAKRAAAGEQPGGAAAKVVEVTADVVAVNAKTQTVTLKGPNQTVDLKVRDPAQFKLIKVGDQVEAVYQQAVAVGVEPATPVKK